jgi:flagellar biosynthetic protein FlhB
MAEEDDDSKTEQPSDRKLSHAREEGDVAQSQEIKTAAVLLAATVVVWLMAPMIMGRVATSLTSLLERPHAIPVGTEAELMVVIGSLLAHVGLIAAIPLVFLLVVGLVSAVAQTGLMITPGKLVPDLNKLNPMAGLSRMFSVRSVVEFAKSILKLLVVGSISYALLKPRMHDLESLVGMGLAGILDYIHSTLVHLLIGVVLAVVVIAAID